ncbi:low molecular weight protein arginine phosphatase [Clostridium kluyveri]|uniref:Protein tyrosine phosphatase n=1 Tax=Clostridium kluyveri TaxID=1534 RepID=A0A1L5FDC6_CLOKL|nr:low molecular weight protein arginine phosphatase [Clostridium kluyveri]APM41011.1 protein tyrosine phosphatase [Clostridium kluyveri]UZQ48709.1 low molecular weight protein arginine phosphatase [Clostridium kluyveri]
MENILFVCTGNTCRSCMAEVIFNSKSDIKDIKAVSAGLSVVPNSIASRNSVVVLKENIDVDISSRKALQLSNSMIKDSKIILTMTAYMRDILRQNFTNFKNKIYTLNEFVSLKGDIKDPFGQDIYKYRIVYAELENSISLLIKKLKEDISIN